MKKMHRAAAVRLSRGARPAPVRCTGEPVGAQAERSTLLPTRCTLRHTERAYYSSTFFPYSFRSSQLPLSSKEPSPMRPVVKVLSLAVMTGFCMSSK